MTNASFLLPEIGPLLAGAISAFEAIFCHQHPPGSSLYKAISSAITQGFAEKIAETVKTKIEYFSSTFQYKSKLLEQDLKENKPGKLSDQTKEDIRAILSDIEAAVAGPDAPLLNDTITLAHPAYVIMYPGEFYAAATLIFTLLVKRVMLLYTLTGSLSKMAIADVVGTADRLIEHVPAVQNALMERRLRVIGNYYFVSGWNSVWRWEDPGGEFTGPMDPATADIKVVSKENERPRVFETVTQNGGDWTVSDGYKQYKLKVLTETLEAIKKSPYGTIVTQHWQVIRDHWAKAAGLQ